MSDLNHDQREQIIDIIFDDLNHDGTHRSAIGDVADRILALFAGWSPPPESRLRVKTKCPDGCAYCNDREYGHPRHNHRPLTNEELAEGYEQLYQWAYGLWCIKSGDFTYAHNTDRLVDALTIKSGRVVLEENH